MERNKMNARLIVFAGVALVAVWGAEGKLAPPKLEDYTHVCRKCGGATHYPKSYTEPRSTVEGLRDGCAKLRSLGLDITLDESVLCRHCVCRLVCSRLERGNVEEQSKHAYSVERHMAS